MLAAIKLAAERALKLSTDGDADDAAAAGGAGRGAAASGSSGGGGGRGAKRRRTLPPAAVDQWQQLVARVDHVSRQISKGPGAPIFAFVEGALVRALRTGGWILLDEINLAPPETLERLAGILEARRRPCFCFTRLFVPAARFRCQFPSLQLLCLRLAPPLCAALDRFAAQIKVPWSPLTVP